jgi:hypothetical protein
MTDTATPFPEPKINDPAALTSEQLRRATALDIARATLISRTGLFGGQQVGPSFDVQDLLTVAEWVLNEPLILTATALTPAEQGYEPTGSGLWRPLPTDNTEQL